TASTETTTKPATSTSTKKTSTEPTTTTKSPEELKQESKEVPYETLFRGFDKYTEDSTPLHYPYGYIYQTRYNFYGDGIHHYQLQVSTTDDEWQGDIAAIWDGDKRLLEDDRVEIWGSPTDLFKYKTVKGNRRTIPRLVLFDATVKDATS
ncbi:hypothetical protein KVP02_13230, partial [Halobacterium salinarum]|uniref:hypothetical protein n=1 Tax=Halobacterium salinarum TaxID=2242 RepID=UPI001F452A18